jgi:hypothetical protein
MFQQMKYLLYYLKEKMPKKKIDYDWQAIIDGNRIGITNVIKGIRNGEVDELELEKLNNFVQFSLALMQLSGPDKWARAKMNAEMMNYIKSIDS